MTEVEHQSNSQTDTHMTKSYGVSVVGIDDLYIIIGSDNALWPVRHPAIIQNNGTTNIARWTNAWNSNLKSQNFIKENTYEKVVCEKLTIWGWPQWLGLSWWPRDVGNIMHFAVAFSKWLYVQGRIVLWLWPRTRMRLLFSNRNYSVETFCNDVSECVWLQTFRKRVKYIISQWLFLRMLPWFGRLFSQNVRCFSAPGVTL